MVRVTFRGPNGQNDIDALVDTGFSGFLSLPLSLIFSLGWRWFSVEEGERADGRTEFFDIYEGTILWDGYPRTVEADAIESQPLIGMGLIQGRELLVQGFAGGMVTIRSLP